MDPYPSSAGPAALISQATHGDKQALAVLYEAYYLPVFRFALKRLENRAEAEDIAQGVFMKLYQTRAAYTDKKISPLAYLFTMARNLIIDQVRKNNRQKTVALEPESYDIPGENHGPAAANRRTVWETLAEVNDTERRVLVLKFIEGFSTAEIAAQLSLTTDNIRQLQCRALKKMRSSLAAN